MFTFYFHVYLACNFYEYERKRAVRENVFDNEKTSHQHNLALFSPCLSIRLRKANSVVNNRARVKFNCSLSHALCFNSVIIIIIHEFHCDASLEPNSRGPIFKKS